MDTSERDTISRWLIDNGAPRLADHYSPLENTDALSFVLAVVVGFELGMAPFMKDAAAWVLLFLPLVLALCAGLLIFAFSRLRRIGHAGLRALAGAGFGILILLGYKAASRYFPEALWSDFSFNSLALFGVVFLSIQLSKTPPRESFRRQLFGLGVLVVFVVGFAIEGPPLFRYPWYSYAEAALRTHAGGILQYISERIYLPYSLPVLIVLVVLWKLVAVKPSEDVATVNEKDWTYPRSLATHVTRLLTLLLGLQVAYFPVVFGGDDQILASIAGLALVVALALLTSAVRRRWTGADRVMPWWLPTVMYFTPAVILIVVGYPLEVGRIGFDGGQPSIAQSLQGIRLQGHLFNGIQAAGIVLAVNLILLAGGLFAAAVAADRIISWAADELLDRWRDIARPMVGHLGAVLVASIVILLSSEVWQVLYRGGTDRSANFRYLAIISVLVVFCLGLPLIDSLRAVRNAVVMIGDDAEVASILAAGTGTQAELVATASTEWIGVARIEDQALKLTPLQWINVTLIALTYRLAFLITLSGGFFLVLTLVAQALVGTHDAAGWIFSQPSAAQLDDLAGLRGTGESPWLRIAILLTLLIALERMIRLQADDEERDKVFGTSDEAIRRRLALWTVLQRTAQGRRSSNVAKVRDRR